MSSKLASTYVSVIIPDYRTGTVVMDSPLFLVSTGESVDESTFGSNSLSSSDWPVSWLS